MSEHRTPRIACAVCGIELEPQDVVIVTREIVPAWATSTPETTTVVHRACEFRDSRADHTWTREPPQTMAHVMAILAVGSDSVFGRAHAANRRGLLPTASSDRS